jgi:hypothetical protein
MLLYDIDDIDDSSSIFVLCEKKTRAEIRSLSIILYSCYLTEPTFVIFLRRQMNLSSGIKQHPTVFEVILRRYRQNACVDTFAAAAVSPAFVQ